MTNIDTSKIPQLDRIELMLQLAFKHMLMPDPETRFHATFGGKVLMTDGEQDLLSSLIHTEHYGT